MIFDTCRCVQSWRCRFNVTVARGVRISGEHASQGQSERREAKVALCGWAPFTEDTIFRLTTDVKMLQSLSEVWLRH